jgi:predicted XRE-type DNA-binding protein
MKFLEFTALVASDTAIISYLRENGLLVRSVICERCNKRMNEQVWMESRDGRAFRCTKCKSRKSIRTHSFFARSRLSIQIIACIIYLLSADVLQKTVAEMLDVDKDTVCDFANLLREEMSQKLIRDDEKLGGQGVIVQVRIDN